MILTFSLGYVLNSVTWNMMYDISILRLIIGIACIGCVVFMNYDIKKDINSLIGAKNQFKRILQSAITQTERSHIDSN